MIQHKRRLALQPIELLEKFFLHQASTINLEEGNGQFLTSGQILVFLLHLPVTRRVALEQCFLYPNQGFALETQRALARCASTAKLNAQSSSMCIVKLHAWQ